MVLHSERLHSSLTLLLDQSHDSTTIASDKWPLTPAPRLSPAQISARIRNEQVTSATPDVQETCVCDIVLMLHSCFTQKRRFC